MESFFSRIKTTKVRASQSLFQLQSRPFELFPAPVWKRYSSLSSTCLLPLLYLETEMFDLSPSRFPFLAPFPSPGSFPQALSVVQTSPNHSRPRNSSTTRDFWLVALQPLRVLSFLFLAYTLPLPTCVQYPGELSLLHAKLYVLWDKMGSACLCSLDVTSPMSCPVCSTHARHLHL